MFTFSDLIWRNVNTVVRTFIYDRQKAVREALVLLLSLGATGYFVYHTIYGRHGLEARQALIEKSSILDFEISSLETVRDQLRRDVALLSPEVPNQDLVEEIARDMLGYVRSTDEILIRPVSAP